MTRKYHFLQSTDLFETKLELDQTIEQQEAVVARLRQLRLAILTELRRRDGLARLRKSGLPAGARLAQRLAGAPPSGVHFYDP